MIFLAPFDNLFFHFAQFFRVERPEAALSRVLAVGPWFLDFLKAFIQGQVVAHRVFPPVGSSAEVRKVVAVIKQKKS